MEERGGGNRRVGGREGDREEKKEARKGGREGDRRYVQMPFMMRLLINCDRPGRSKMLTLLRGTTEKSMIGFSRKVTRTVLAWGKSGTSSISMRSLPSNQTFLTARGRLAATV